MSRKRRTRKLPKPGDDILCGRPGISFPQHWMMARVLWTDGVDMLTEHQAPSGPLDRNVLPVDHALCIGSIQELGDFKRRALKEFAAEIHKVERAEAALGKAREAMWAALDRMVAQ